MNSPLLSEIEQSIQKHQRLGPLDYYLAEFLSWLAVVASVIAGLSVTNEWFARDVRALVAVVPALAWALLRTFQYEARSNWHYQYHVRLQALKRELRDQGVSVAAVSQRLGNLDLEMDAKFPRREVTTRATTQPSAAEDRLT